MAPGFFIFPVLKRPLLHRRSWCRMRGELWTLSCHCSTCRTCVVPHTPNTYGTCLVNFLAVNNGCCFSRPFQTPCIYRFRAGPPCLRCIRVLAVQYPGSSCGHSVCGERGAASSPSEGLSSEVFSTLHGPCSSGPSRKPLLQESSQLCPQRSWPLCQGHYLPHLYWNLRLGTSWEAIPGPVTWSV